MIEINKIKSPFIYYCQKVIPLAFDESLSYYEMLCNLTAKIKEVIDEQNIEGQAIEELQNKYLLLVDYVDHYFDNLDIQEEINNKLDEMAESGELTDIIAQYINLKGVLAYNNKEELKNATNIANGSIAKTLGNIIYSDGLGSYWKIRTILNTDIIDDINILQIQNDDTLVAEKINDPIITNLINNVEQINEEIENNKVQQLSDSVQARFYKELTGLFQYSSGWSLSSCLIIGNKGIAAANDWTQNGSQGLKFNIVTFNYENETISNIVTRYQLVDGHSNSMCQIDNDNILICAMEHSYIYNLTNNTYTETTVAQNLSACANNGSDIYASDPSNNVLYKLSFNNNTLTIEDTYTIENLYETLNGGSQGMVIYDNKLIFIGFHPVCLAIYDLNTKELLKNQLFTTPYECEYEDGFIYNNTLYLVSAEGRLFIPDIYGKHNIGGYSNYNLTKSLTDIVLFNTPTLLTWNTDNAIIFNDVMHFATTNSNTDIGTIGSQFESFTIYLGFSTDSNTCHCLKPFDILCYKTLDNANLYNGYGTKMKWLSKKFSGDYYVYFGGVYERYTVSGNIDFGGGDSVPTLLINPYPLILHENFTSNTKELINSNYNYSVFLLKIIGHKKSREGY